MDADTLRIILAVFGALALVALYLWERRRQAPEDDFHEDDDSGGDGRREPRLEPWEEGPSSGHASMRGAASSESGDHARGRQSPLPDSGSVPADSSQAPDQPEFRLEPPPKPASEKAAPPGSLILLLHVVSTDEPFDGSTVVQAAGKCGLEPGEMEIFHRHLEPEAPGEPLFSMANMVKPGTFPFGAMAEFTSPGLALFSQANGSPDDPGRLEEMLATARCLAAELGGQIQDEKRNALTSATEQRLRERVMELVVRGLER